MTARRILATIAILTGLTSVASAQSATQTVTFQIDAINQVSLSGSPSKLSSSSLSFATRTGQCFGSGATLS